MLDKMLLVSTGLMILGFSLHAQFGVSPYLGAIPALFLLVLCVLGLFKAVSSPIDIGEIETTNKKQAPDDHDIEFRVF